MQTVTANQRPAPDQLLIDIADYVTRAPAFSDEAFTTARHCLIDSIGCGLLALQFPDCARHLGPVVHGAVLPNGARVPGTSYQLDPIHAAFNIGCMIRWLDFNDTWLAAEWGHPSDNLGAILGVADYLSRNGNHLTMRDVLIAMIQAHEIQGVLALKNSFNRVGLDHVVLVKVASTAVATHLLGGTRYQIIDALSQAFVDGQSLRTYRHAPNTGSRKSWAAGDATSRAVRLALITLKGEMGLPSVLSAPVWGFQDVLFKKQPLVVDRPFGCYVMEQILFKISFPAEFHAQTAVEAAITLHAQTKFFVAYQHTRGDAAVRATQYAQTRKLFGRIKTIRVWTQEPAIRIISKSGPLANPADRDHCLQYIIAVALLHGDLRAEMYSDAFHAADAERIDALRAAMVIEEDPAYTRDYLDPDKRSIANAIQIEFTDGNKSPKVAVEYPIGHSRRRAEGIPLLERKFRSALRGCFNEDRSHKIEAACADQAALEAIPVNQFMDMFVIP